MSSNVPCPSCSGRGVVSAEEAVAIYQAREGIVARKTRPVGTTCHCDGPAHRYDPLRPDPDRPGRTIGWCPASGPK